MRRLEICSLTHCLENRPICPYSILSRSRNLSNHLCQIRDALNEILTCVSRIKQGASTHRLEWKFESPAQLNARNARRENRFVVCVWCVSLVKCCFSVRGSMVISSTNMFVCLFLKGINLTHISHAAFALLLLCLFHSDFCSSAISFPTFGSSVSAVCFNRVVVRRWGWCVRLNNY